VTPGEAEERARIAMVLDLLIGMCGSWWAEPGSEVAASAAEANMEQAPSQQYQDYARANAIAQARGGRAA
jgi:hypothetical protein